MLFNKLYGLRHQYSQHKQATISFDEKIAREFHMRKIEWFIFCFIQLHGTHKRARGLKSAAATSAANANIMHVTVFAMTNSASDDRKKNFRVQAQRARQTGELRIDSNA